MASPAVSPEETPLSQVMDAPAATRSQTLDSRLVELQRALHEVPTVKIVDVLPAASRTVYFRIILSEEDFDARQQVLDMIDDFHHEFVEEISVEVYVSDWEHAPFMLADC